MSEETRPDGLRDGESRDGHGGIRPVPPGVGAPAELHEAACVVECEVSDDE